jgi:hypothetical protein
MKTIEHLFEMEGDKVDHDFYDFLNIFIEDIDSGELKNEFTEVRNSDKNFTEVSDLIVDDKRILNSTPNSLLTSTDLNQISIRGNALQTAFQKTIHFSHSFTDTTARQTT